MRRVCLPAVLALALVAGCGGDDDGDSNADKFEGDERDVAALVDDFAEAGRDGDGERVCDEIFLPTLSRNIEQASGQSCASEVQENLPEGEYELTVTDIKVRNEAATAAVNDQDDQGAVLHLLKRDDAWRVARVTPGF